MTTQFWKRWKQPWTHEQCRLRYVEGGDNIGIRQLSKDSGQPKGTIGDWSKQEEWVDQRERFQDNLRTTTREKIIEKTSEKLSDELSEIATTNYKAHRLARDYAVSIISIKARHMQVIQQMSFEQQLDAIKSHNAHEMNFWSLILSRATEGIATATGLPYYIDVSAAARRVEKEGLIISDPTREYDESDE